MGPHGPTWAKKPTAIVANRSFGAKAKLGVAHDASVVRDGRPNGNIRQMTWRPTEPSHGPGEAPSPAGAGADVHP